MRAAGLKTGLFVSPHISSFRERIQVNGQLISQDDFIVSFDSQHFPFKVRRSISIKFYHFATGILFQQLCSKLLSLCLVYNLSPLNVMLLFWRQSSSKYSVILFQVGCGGEWDATNVIESSLSIICSVGHSSIF